MQPESIGPYRILRVLGKGGMGTVYEAIHSETGDQVALKLLSATHADDDHFRTRFAAEIEALLKLDHPNIVRLSSHGQSEGQLFFTMEFIEARSLHEAQKQGRLFNWREVIDITRQICAGLRHAHDRGIIHRDIKPGNLLITDDGVVKLTDFGIAKLFGGRQLTAVGGVVGTVDYMSPEQLLGKTATVRSDMYALGAVLYMLLARRPPFSFTSIADALRTIERDTPTRLLVLVPECPPQLDRLIMKLLNREPSQRIGTAQALAKRLDHLAHDLKAWEKSQSSGSDDDAFEVIEGPVPARETFDLGMEVFNQPTAPAEDSAETGEEDGDSGELSLAPLDDDDTPPAKTVRNTAGMTVSPESRADYFQPVTPRTLVGEEEPTEPDRGPIWPYAIGLVLLLGICGLGIYWTLIHRASADELYEQIVATVEDSDDPSDARESIDQFLQRFPNDERRPQIEEYREQLAAARLPRRIEQKARLRGFFHLSPLEQDFLVALQMAELNPQAARDRFQAIVDVYQDLPLDRDEQQCVIASRQQVKYLDGQIARNMADRRDEIESALKLADSIRGDNPERAGDIARGIITLYEEVAWAHDLVTEARVTLAESEAQQARDDE